MIQPGTQSGTRTLRNDILINAVIFLVLLALIFLLDFRIY
jgi:hypothetical protein